jgi:NADH dehydrogenase
MSMSARGSPAGAIRGKRVVVVGGGAGGLHLVRRLATRLGRHGAVVTLLDRNASHIWKPLLHEVAAGALDAGLDEVGYAGHAARWGYRFVQGSLEALDRERREVVVAPVLDDDGSELLAKHRIPYDVLILSVGAVSNDYGTPGVRENCLFLEDRQQADRFRRKLLGQCMRVARELEANPGSSARVTIAIVGGGATGVELAAELYNAATALGAYGLDGFDRRRVAVTLIEAGPRILPALPEDLAKAAREELETLGVRVLSGTAVAEATPDSLIARDGTRIPAALRVWAAGVRGPDVLAGIGGLTTTPTNQIRVSATLQSKEDDRIFAIGDCALCVLPGQTRAVPPRAQAAHQMAATAARNIEALLAGRPMHDFVYRDRGSLVSLSRFSTVGSLMGNLIGGRMAVEGRIARLVYVSLYRIHLIGVHGWPKGIAMIVVGHVQQVLRPRLKLH